MINITKEKPILLIGGDGNIGRFLTNRLLQKLSADCIVLASNQPRSDTLEKDVRHSSVEITDETSVKNLFNTINPSIVVHLAALTNVNAQEADPVSAFKINTEGTKNLINNCGTTPFFLFSTDYVFSGKEEKFYSESDTPDPESVYGKSKAEAEGLVLNHANGFVFRISFPWYPLSFHSKITGIKDTAIWIFNNLIEGKDTPCYTNVLGSWTPMLPFADNFLEIVEKVIGKNIRILNVVGNKFASPYDVGIALEQKLKACTKNLVLTHELGKILPSVLVPEPGKAAPRPEKGNLGSRLLVELGFDFSDIVSQIESGRWAADTDILEYAKTKGLI